MWDLNSFHNCFQPLLLMKIVFHLQFMSSEETVTLMVQLAASIVVSFTHRILWRSIGIADIFVYSCLVKTHSRFVPQCSFGSIEETCMEFQNVLL